MNTTEGISIVISADHVAHDVQPGKDLRLMLAAHQQVEVYVFQNERLATTSIYSPPDNSRTIIRS